MGITYNQFRSKFKGSGLNNKQISKLWRKYKKNLITDQNLTQTNIKKLILTEKTKIKESKVDLIDYFSKQPPEMVRLMLLKLKIKEINTMCHINKYFKYKVFTNYFWRLYINKNWKDMNKAFLWAVENEYIRLIKILLEDPKVDPASNYNWPIQLASLNGSLEVVKLLLSLPEEVGIDPSADDNYAIQMASRAGHLDVVNCFYLSPRNPELIHLLIITMLFDLLVKMAI